MIKSTALSNLLKKAIENGIDTIFISTKSGDILCIEGNGTIDRKEFLQLMARKIRDFDDEDEYIEAFRIFDRNNDDLISVEEMKEIMTILGQWVWKVSPTEEEMVEMIREADTDSDGYLHYKDFINKIKSIR